MHGQHCSTQGRVEVIASFPFKTMRRAMPALMCVQKRWRTTCTNSKVSGSNTPSWLGRWEGRRMNYGAKEWNRGNPFILRYKAISNLCNRFQKWLNLEIQLGTKTIHLDWPGITLNMSCSARADGQDSDGINRLHYARMQDSLACIPLLPAAIEFPAMFCGELSIKPVLASLDCRPFHRVWPIPLVFLEA